MSEQEHDITWEAIRTNWPIILAIVIAVGSWIKLEMSIQSAQSRIESIESLFDHAALREFARWQVNIERDIRELRGCGK